LQISLDLACVSRENIRLLGQAKMTNEDKMNELAEMFEVDASDLSPETKLDTLNWDSMMKLSLIALLKTKFDKRIAGETLKELQTVGDMLALME